MGDRKSRPPQYRLLPTACIVHPSVALYFMSPCLFHLSIRSQALPHVGLLQAILSVLCAISLTFGNFQVDEFVCFRLMMDRLVMNRVLSLNFCVYKAGECEVRTF